MTALTHTKRLRYRGDVTEAVGQMVGPNEWGERYVVAEATYDPARDLTTVYLRYATAKDVVTS
jgi:hypothetical protein